METSPPVGEMLTVNGHQMHVYQSGQQQEGAPTLVLTAGSGTTSPYADFSPLYEPLKDYHFVLYERPGYGWSENTTESRSVDTVVDELRALLQQAGEKPPYVFVAHSMGALETIRYAQRYPDEVEALVMIDGISPHYAEQFHMGFTQTVGWSVMKGLRDVGVMSALTKLGVMDRLFIDIEDLPEDLQRLKVAMALKNMNNASMKEEMRHMSANGKKIREAGSIGTTPMLLFSATNNGYENWEQTQQELESMSSTSERVIFENTKHYIHHEKSAQIVQEITRFLHQFNN